MLFSMVISIEMQDAVYYQSFQFFVLRYFKVFSIFWQGVNTDGNVAGLEPDLAFLIGIFLAIFKT